jgi:energy-coupling factor transport system permease protein
MLKDITLGQFFPGDTIVHRLDPRTKLILVIVFIAALFTAVDWFSYGLMFLVTAGCISLSKIRLRTLTKGLKPLIFIIVLTGVLNLFYTTGGRVLIDWWIFTVTTEGVKRAFLMIARIMMLIMGTFLLTYTTSPIALTDGLEILLGPLKKLRVPVHEMSMMMSMALRFIPTLIEETDKIMSAQKARGADFETGKLTERAKALLPLLVPLFVSSFRRADELAVAMESRCYHGGEGRTRMKQLHMQGRDWAALALGALVLAATIVMNVYGL